MGKDNRPFGQCEIREKPQPIVVLRILELYIHGTVPTITPLLPTIARILRTTAGVKPLTHTLSQWDNADTGRTREITRCSSKSRVRHKSLGRVKDRWSGDPRE